MLSVPTGRDTLQETMLLIRLLEDRLQGLCDAGEGADLHFNRGQEAIAVGVMAALRPTDYLVTHHRTIAHAIAKGVPLRPLIAELLGKAEGLAGGLGGEMAMSHPASRYMMSFQLVGTAIPFAAGIAWAVKHVKRADDVVAVFFGDAATANGQFHEGVNLAAVLGLPLLLVCENNGLAGNVRAEQYLPVQHVYQRALGYGIEFAMVDGNDVGAVRRVAGEAEHYVRSRSRPFLLECVTTRLGKHKQGMGDLRTREEMERLASRDPLRHMDIPEEQQQAVRRELDAIIESVRNGPDPAFPKEE